MTSRSAFALVAAFTLCVAIGTVVVFSGDSSSRAAELLTKGKVAKPAAASLVHTPLPAALRAAEHAEEVAQKKDKERVLASAAKNALQEYSSFRKQAKVALQQQDAHVRNLVSSAAKELIAEEALAKQKAAEKHHDAGSWGEAAHKKLTAHDSLASRWRAQMEEAEKAALDVIQRTDTASKKSASAWKSYAEKQKQKIASVQKHEAVLEKKQDSHIKKMVQEGKIKATTPLHQLKHAAKPLSPKAKAAIAKKLAVKAANAALKKQNGAAATAKANHIAQKELPRLEAHLKDQVKSMEARKKWDSLQRSAAQKEKELDGSWMHTVAKVHAKVARERVIAAAKASAEARKNALTQSKIKAATAKHLASEVAEIVGGGEKKKIVSALHNLKEKHAAAATPSHPQAAKPAVAHKIQTKNQPHA